MEICGSSSDDLLSRDDDYFTTFVWMRPRLCLLFHYLISSYSLKIIYSMLISLVYLLDMKESFEIIIQFMKFLISHDADRSIVFLFFP